MRLLSISFDNPLRNGRYHPDTISDPCLTDVMGENRSKIIITSRRRISQVFWQDARVKFIPIDFLKPIEELVQIMEPLCQDVTHAFFASYVHTADFAKLSAYNMPLFTNFLNAIDTVAGDKLQRVCLHTGGKVRISLAA